MTPKIKNLLVRTITGLLFVAVMVTGLCDSFAMTVLFALITGLSIWEYTGLANTRSGVKVNRFISTAAAVYLYIAVAAWRTGAVAGFVVFIPYLLTIIYLFVSELYIPESNAIDTWAHTMLGQMYIALPFSMINILAFEVRDGGIIHFDETYGLAVFVFLWMNDTGAFCTGSLLGRHKLFPRISPNKTWEGFIGGVALTVVVAAAFGLYLNSYTVHNSLTIYHWMGLGVVVSVCGTWGDLVESLFKRTLSVKDSGNLLPGHGGLLDRFDSALMAIPSAVIYLYTISLF